MKVESRLSKERNDKLQCLVCRHQCTIAEGKSGICKTVVNEGRKLYSIIYGTLTGEAVDPIEKKPLFHFWPNSQTYSISSSSCNFQCPWCQNWHISNLAPEETTSWERTPEAIVKKAASLGLTSISYTYNEPSIWFEFINDTAKLAKTRGMYNTLVTNGYYSHEALEEYSDLIDAVNIDVKGFNEQFYRKYVKASLEQTLESILETSRSGIHVELTMLIIPTLNDDPREINDFIKWVVVEMGPDIPVHFTRFFPHYRMARLPPTPVETLKEAWNVAKAAGLNYVYIGNIPIGYEDTFCPQCGKKVIRRGGFGILAWKLDDKNRCLNCGAKIPFVGKYVNRKNRA